MSIFMVEVFRPTLDESRIERAGAGEGSFLCAIDIPTDELTLYLVAARDAAEAELLLRHRGVRTLRVTVVDLFGSSAFAPDVRDSPDVGSLDRPQPDDRGEVPPPGEDGASERRDR